MTSIGAVGSTPFPLAATPQKLNIAEPPASPLEEQDEGVANDRDSVSVDMQEYAAKADLKSNPADLVAQLQKQIDETEKTLTEQQSQLSGVQKGQASEEQKAQQAMEVQAQIAITASNLQVLQAALLQALTARINTTA
ncbi:MULTISPECIES: hypothetical protein [Pseudomonas]|uniref:Uncharacterized protein n=1 Tax=Pseudomonas chlororaphis TaxID=587753 RepID=A0A0D5XVQ6_9PSED|nr:MULTISPECIES: hypothetical protein [Pseudomonas]AJO80408.1 hypothetical protein TO66_25235 [Pseudomonas sp. MRSN 12121]AKA22769.1 hypothetical protein PCL1606_13140 [Pseudomonas chlororaphis]